MAILEPPAKSAHRETVRLCFMGSVDDGKSTLIGRMLVDTGSLHSDSLKSLIGPNGIELSWATDGLASEREQGITIDIAYRHFSSSQRDYLLADAPGHTAHTRNMVTGASFADFGVVLIDAARGVTEQTVRHLAIAEFCGMKQIVFAINKMDLVNYSSVRFSEINERLATICKTLNVTQTVYIPVSGLMGENVLRSSSHMTWFDGPSLLETIDSIEPISSVSNALRLPIQTVIRSGDRRFYAGRISSGSLRVGETVRLIPSLRSAQVKSLLVSGEATDMANCGDSVAVAFTDEVDLSRGEMISSAESPPVPAQDIVARVLWFSRSELKEGDSLILKHGTLETKATVTEISAILDLETLGEISSESVKENELARVEFRLARRAGFDTFQNCAPNGRFMLIDRLSFETVGAGTIVSSMEPGVQTRKPSAGVTIWMTGLPGSGKTTIAEALKAKFFERGQTLVVLDGDSIRTGLSKDLGFSPDDRAENQRRVAEVCKLLNDSGLAVVVALISPAASERTRAKETIGHERFREVFVDASLDECVRRDPKGLYAKALRHEISNFTGISAPYDVPGNPDFHLCTERLSVEECVETLILILEPTTV